LGTKGLLPDQLKDKTAGQITTIPHKKAFKEAFVTACSEVPLQDFLIVGILLPFETEWHKLSNTQHSTQKGSSNHVDAVALMA